MGLSPKEALTTPICFIYDALDGHMDYLRKTSVLRGGPSIEEKKEMTVEDQVKSVLGGLSRG